MSRIQKATDIALSALKVIQENGQFKEIENVDGKPLSAEINQFTIFYTTPFARLPGMDEYLIDIWWTHGKKIFSARWKREINDLTIVNFQRGDWEDFFVSRN